MIDQIRNLAKKEYYSDLDWEYHIKIVVDYALLLADKLKADKEIVEISALLHDIGKKKFGGENHNLTSAEEAAKILPDFGIGKDKVDKIVHCVRAHRGRDIETETIEAEIIRNADAMSHYDIFPYFFFDVKETRKDIKERLDWAKTKFDRNWDKKITLPEAKELVKEKRDAVNLLLEAMIEL